MMLLDVFVQLWAKACSTTAQRAHAQQIGEANRRGIGDEQERLVLLLEDGCRTSQSLREQTQQ